MISSFFDISLKRNSLVILDIDDTVIYYKGIDKQWWTDTFSKEYEKTRDYDITDVSTDNIWYETIKILNPSYTDMIGYENLLFQCMQTDSKIIFISLRKEEEETRNRLKYYLKVKRDDIHCIGYKNKALYVKENISLDSYKDILFIDDQDNNLNDFKEHFPDSNVYKFINSKVD